MIVCVHRNGTAQFSFHTHMCMCKNLKVITEVYASAQMSLKCAMHSVHSCSSLCEAC